MEFSSATSLRRRLRDERGFTMVEVLVASVLLTSGLAIASLGFIGPNKLTYAATREAQAAQIAEADIENIEARPFSEVATTSYPSWSADTDASVSGYTSNPNNPHNPLYYVDDPSSPISFGTGSCTAANYPHGTFPALLDFNQASLGQIPDDANNSNAPCGEAFVTSSTGGVPVQESTASVFSGDSTAAAAAPAGQVYNFITYRTEACDTTASNVNTQQSTIWGDIVAAAWGSITTNELIQDIISTLFGNGSNGTKTTVATEAATNFCNTQLNYEKRITVAVVLNDASNQTAATRPVWISTVYAEPDGQAGAPEASDVSNCSGSFACG